MSNTMDREPIITIRTAGPGDAALIAALATTTFYEAYFEQDEAGDLASYILESFAQHKIKAELEDSACTFFIASVNGKGVGYAKLRENSKAECVRDLNTVELQRIYILHKLKGKGVGRVLMEKCFETARERGFDSLWLGVWSENRPAQRFYDSIGFRRVGELQFPYGGQLETNFVMLYDLRRPTADPS